MSDEYKVRVEADGVVYRGRRSVRQVGNHVWIDGKLVDVECDRDGKPLTAAPAQPEPLPTVKIENRWFGWFKRRRGAR